MLSWFLAEFFSPIVVGGFWNAFVGAKRGYVKPCLLLSFDQLQNFRFVYHLYMFWLKINQPRQLKKDVLRRMLTIDRFKIGQKC